MQRGNFRINFGLNLTKGLKMGTVENDLANYECETAQWDRNEAAKERWLAGEADLVFSDKELQFLALEWWQEETGAADLLMAAGDLARWVGVPTAASKVIQLESFLVGVIEEICLCYAERVRWPAYCKNGGI